MDVEDEIIAELENKERRIGDLIESINQKDKAISEKDKAISDKDKALSDKDKLIEELKRKLGEK